MSLPLSTERKAQLLRSVRRFDASFVPLRAYVSSAGTDAVDLDAAVSGQPPTPTYLHLLDTLFVLPSSPNASGSAPSPPPAAPPPPSRSPSPVPLPLLLSHVISASLRRRNPAAAARANVLCAGFSLAHPDGTPSSLPNLDCRARSAPVEELARRPWSALATALGQPFFVYLLSNCVLVRAVFSPSTSPASKWAFVQMCGPDLVTATYSTSTKYARADAVISIKRDLMYRVPTQRTQSGCDKRAANGQASKRQKQTQPQTSAKETEKGEDESCMQLANDALPKTHHLQQLPASNSFAASILLPIIFGDHSSVTSAGSAKCDKISFSSNPPSTSATAPRSRYGDHGRVRNYDTMTAKLLSRFSAPNRATNWLAVRKATSRPGRLRQVAPLLATLVANFRRCSFRRLLGRTCPLPPLGGADTPEHIGMHTAPKDVARFAHSCCRALVPLSLLGSKHNLRVFQRAVRRLVMHRHMNESFDVARFVRTQGFRLTDVEWLYNVPGKRRNAKRKRPESQQSDEAETAARKRVANPTDFKYRQAKVTDLFVWIFRGFVVPLLQQTFYATEGNATKNRVFFYRREVWVRMVNAANHEVLRRNGQFAVLSKRALRDTVVQRSAEMKRLGKHVFPTPVLVYHDVRYIPKRASLRRIQRPRAKALSGFSCLPSSSATPGKRRHQEFGLRHGRLLATQLLAVLRVEAGRDRGALGASVFSLDDIYARWLPLKAAWRAAGRPRMHAVAVDVAQAFETIPMRALTDDIVPRLLSRDQYALLRMRVVTRSDSRRAVSRVLTYVRTVAADYAPFPRLVSARFARAHPSAFFTDLAHSAVLHRADALAMLRAALSSNLVIVPKRARRHGESGFARQARGVPQGHPLSPLLASLFYGHVERTELSEFITQQPSSPSSSLSLLMRLVDDSLYVGSEASAAARFLRRVASAPGLAVNADKTQETAGGTVAWCGLHVDTRTLELRSDLARYGRLRDYVAADGAPWRTRAAACFFPKLHPLLLDARVNSPRTVCANIFHAAAVCALKACALLARQRPRSPSYVAEGFSDAARNFAALVRAALRRRVRGTHGRIARFLSNADIHLIVSSAFYHAVRRHVDAIGKAGPHVVRAMEQRLRDSRVVVKRRIGGSVFVRAVERIAHKDCDDLWRIEL